MRFSSSAVSFVSAYDVGHIEPSSSANPEPTSAAAAPRLDQPGEPELEGTVDVAAEFECTGEFHVLMKPCARAVNGRAAFSASMCPAKTADRLARQRMSTPRARRTTSPRTVTPRARMPARIGARNPVGISPRHCSFSATVVLRMAHGHVERGQAAGTISKRRVISMDSR